MSVALVSVELCEKVQTAPHVALYLDFDGTLAPIVERVEEARLPEAVRDMLARLARDPRFTIAIVSGRAIADLKRRVVIPGLTYVGNHGLEISGPDISFRAEESAAFEARLRNVLAVLDERLGHIPGAQVENKGLTASVHFRRVEPQRRDEVMAIVRDTVPANDPQLILRDAKMVIEIRPRGKWNKGEAVLWIREKLALSPALEVYIGDDSTDEDAFKLLPEAFTIRVGMEGESAAKYRVADPSDVAVLLKCILDEKETTRGAR
jgi:trehalose 6-phosphate phosphatase